MNDSRVLDNKLLIADEVHNLTNAGQTFPGIGKVKKTSTGAKNLKYVFLWNS